MSDPVPLATPKDVLDALQEPQDTPLEPQATPPERTQTPPLVSQTPPPESQTPPPVSQATPLESETPPLKSQAPPPEFEAPPPEEGAGSSDCDFDAGAENGSPGAFQMVRASEVFAKPQWSGPDADNLPFSLLPGEGVCHLARVRGEGGMVLVITNFRFHATPTPTHGLINVPLGLIESLELKDLFHLYLSCKDGRIFRITFDNNSTAEEWHGRLADTIAPKCAKIEDVFALAHWAWAKEETTEEVGEGVRCRRRTLLQEMRRLKFDLNTWRISKVNQGYKLCGTYPQELICPQTITDAELGKIAQFRSAHRIPSVVWRNVNTGAVLVRCSQPEVGWLGWRCSEDEKMFQVIAQACSYDNGASDSSDDGADAGANMSDLSGEIAKMGELKNVLVIDARSYTAAFGNRARGGGVECQDYYPFAEIIFMNLANIHSIRKSFHLLSLLCNSAQQDWFHALETTKWLSHISGLLKAAVRCAKALEVEGRPVIVHCSDGWDRTPQIVSLAQLLLDPFYRTMVGFQTLVEKEWLDYGHKMADRCGSPFATSDPNERSPVFLQWLDCVHQLLHQYPCHFEFNFTYLVKLAEHVYSNLFGNFLCNSLKERQKHQLSERTRSIWDYLKFHPTKFLNYLYNSNVQEQSRVIWPRVDVKDLFLWQDVYMSESLPSFPSNGYPLNSNPELSQQETLHLATPLTTPSSEAESNTSDTNPEESELDNGVSTHQQIKQQTTPSDSIPTVKEPSAVSKDIEKPKSHSAEENGQEPPRQQQQQLVDSSTDTLVLDEPQKDLMASSGKINKANQTKRYINRLSAQQRSASATPLPANPTFQQSISAPVGRGSSSFSESGMSNVAKELGFSVQQQIRSREPIDSDGLVAHDQKIQQRLAEIFYAHANVVNSLSLNLSMTRKALRSAKMKLAAYEKSGAVVEGILPSANNVVGDYLEESSGVQSGSTTSDTSSWEAVEEGETLTAFWLPDFISPACMRCQANFWFGRRKHHCRACGVLVCGTCSNRFIPLPEMRIFHPVRICEDCFATREQELTNGDGNDSQEVEEEGQEALEMFKKND